MKFDGNMKIWSQLFNIILCGSLLIVASGCNTNAKSKILAKDGTLMAFHMEMASGYGESTMPVQIGRLNPVKMTVQQSPFIREINVLKAEAWDTTDGGIAIRLELDRIGRKHLETASMLHRGARVAVQAIFPEPRWIDIMKLDRHMGDGIIILYPDASPEETDRIVSGLNLVSEAIEEDGDRNEQ